MRGLLRDLLRGALLVGALALAAGCSKIEQALPWRAAPPPAPVVWKMALSWPEGFPVFYAEAARFADLVGRMSGGRMKVELVPAGVHGKPLSVMGMVSSGEYEMAHTASYYFADKDPATVLFTTVPFGMTPVEQYAWFYFGGGLAPMHKAYAPHGIVAFPVGNTHIQMGGWFKNEVRSAADLKGLRMRIPGHAGKVVKRVGMESVSLAGGEIFAAFSAGKLDAAEWVGPGHDSKLRLQERPTTTSAGTSRRPSSRCSSTRRSWRRSHRSCGRSSKPPRRPPPSTCSRTPSTSTRPSGRTC